MINFYTVKFGSGADDEAMDVKRAHVYKSDVYVWLGCRTHPPTLKNGARAKDLAQWCQLLAVQAGGPEFGSPAPT